MVARLSLPSWKTFTSGRVSARIGANAWEFVAATCRIAMLLSSVSSKLHATMPCRAVSAAIGAYSGRIGSPGFPLPVRCTRQISRV